MGTTSSVGTISTVGATSPWSLMPFCFLFLLISLPISVNKKTLSDYNVTLLSFSHTHNFTLTSVRLSSAQNRQSFLLYLVVRLALRFLPELPLRLHCFHSPRRHEKSALIIGYIILVAELTFFGFLRAIIFKTVVNIDGVVHFHAHQVWCNVFALARRDANKAWC